MCSGGGVTNVVDTVFPFFRGPTGIKHAATNYGEATGLLPKPPQMPDVVRTDPVADQAKTETQGAQEAQHQHLMQRRRAQANSLLSRAGGAGDLSDAETATPFVKPKLGS